MQNQFITIRSWPRVFLHIDADAFFASCEQAVCPAYRGKPVVTGKERGIVAAASYEAKARGVKRGVPLWEVKKLCPDAIILPSDYETYSLFSKRMFAIMRRFTPTVEEYSIDEAFLDITGFQRPYHMSYEKIAMKIKESIESELGITVSVGMSLSKVLAKVASKWQKPAGFTAIPGRMIHEFLAKLPIENVWGIGPRTAAYSQALGLSTALDFARKPEEFIKSHFTKPHYEIWQELNGESVYEIVTQEKTDYASISKTKTFTPPSRDGSFVLAQLMKNMENACIKARRHKLIAKGIVVFLKTQDFKTVGLEAKFSRPTAFPSDMVKIVRHLFDKMFDSGRRRAGGVENGGGFCLYRATGVVLTDLIPDENVQLSLFEPAVRIDNMKKIYEAVDDLAAKFGTHAVFTGVNALAQVTPQHGRLTGSGSAGSTLAPRVHDRGDIPVRKLNRLKGESKRKHLALPLLVNRKLY
jgi:DNA polymerase IV